MCTASSFVSTSLDQKPALCSQPNNPPIKPSSWMDLFWLLSSALIHCDLQLRLFFTVQTHGKGSHNPVTGWHTEACIPLLGEINSSEEPLDFWNDLSKYNGHSGNNWSTFLLLTKMSTVRNLGFMCPYTNPATALFFIAPMFSREANFSFKQQWLQ